MPRVRVGSHYTFEPSLWDMLMPNDLHPKQGDEVVVVNQYGCPPANTMGHCYVNDLKGNFCGLVSTASLIPIKKITNRRNK